MSTKIKAVVAECLIVIFEKGVFRAAAALSYYMMMSIFPFLICINWIIGLFDIDFNALAQMLKGIVPNVTIEIMEGYMSYVYEAQSTALLIAGVLSFITTLAAAVRTMLGTFEEINGIGRRKTTIDYLMGFVLAIIFLFGTFICLLVTVMSGMIIDFVERFIRININLYINESLPYVILFGYMFIVLCGLYKLSFAKHYPVSRVWKGALFSAVGVVGVSRLFSTFLSFSTRYSLVYGSLSSVMLLMLWLFLCGLTVILGHVLNRAVNSVRDFEGR